MKELEQESDIRPVDVSGLAVRYGKLEAVRYLDLQVEGGTALGLLGTNGAGKSTALMALAGTLRSSSGGGSVLGAPLGKIKPRQLASRRPVSGRSIALPPGRGVAVGLVGWCRDDGCIRDR